MRFKLFSILFILIISEEIIFCKTYYISIISGDDNNPGIYSSPFKSVQKALKAAKTGDTFFLREGSYPLPINFNRSGTKEKRITFLAYKEEKVIFTGYGYDYKSDNVRPAFIITGNWLVFKNFEVKNGYLGIEITNNASHNILENISIHHNNISGLLITNGASCNSIINCDSYENFDPQNAGEHSDGFAVKGFKSDKVPYAGKGNLFYGCRAWSNSDDGFDFWDAGNSVTVDKCFAYENGFDIWGFGKSFTGNGNGFKLGRSNKNHPNDKHIIKNSFAFNNKRVGFYYNENFTKLHIYNNYAYKNHTNFMFKHAKHILKNNISFMGARKDDFTKEVIQINNHWNFDDIKKKVKTEREK